MPWTWSQLQAAPRGHAPRRKSRQSAFWRPFRGATIAPIAPADEAAVKVDGKSEVETVDGNANAEGSALACVAVAVAETATDGVGACAVVLGVEAKTSPGVKRPVSCFPANADDDDDDDKVVLQEESTSSVASVCRGAATP